MTDIIDRLRGQEPLELGDRLAAATEIERLQAENEEMQQEIAGSIHTCGPTCTKTPNCRMRRENERLQVDMKTCRENFVLANTRIGRLTKAAILRARECRRLLEIIELARDDVNVSLVTMQQVYARHPSYAGRIAEQQNLLDRMNAALKEQDEALKEQDEE